MDRQGLRRRPRARADLGGPGRRRVAYGTDPALASIGFEPGKPAGSAAPLTWAQAQEVRLVQSLAQGRLVEQPKDVATRYAPARSRPWP